MATRQALIRRVLKRLGAYPADGQPAVEDIAIVDDELDDIVEDLRRRDVIDIPDIDDIELGLMQHLSAIVADYVADDFGLSNDEAAKIKGRADEAVRRLAVITRGEILEDEPVKVEYY